MRGRGQGAGRASARRPIGVGDRRARLAGAAFFFTVALADRRSRALVEQIVELRAAFVASLRERPARVKALVALPDHLHAVWTPPEGDNDFPTRWRLIKTRFIQATGLEGRPAPSNIAKAERGVWRRRYWEHRVRDEDDLRRHVEYCWINPVKHGLVTRVRDWPWSSFHRDVRRSVVPEDWAGDAAEGEFGEPVAAEMQGRCSHPPSGAR